MVSAVLDTGLCQTGRIPFDVTAAEVTVVADGFAEVGRVPGMRVCRKPSDVTGVTVPPLVFRTRTASRMAL